MTRTEDAPVGTIAEILAGPEGGHIGAYFDLDGTIVAGFTVFAMTKARLLSGRLGPEELLKLAALGLAFEAGAITFAHLVIESTKAFGGLSQTSLEEFGEKVFRRNIADLVYPEMREVVRAHQSRGHRVVLCSSATSVQVEPVARYLGVDVVRCNRFVVDDEGVLTGDIIEPIIWGTGKAEAARADADEAGIDLADAYFYADGDEDIPLMKAVGNPRPTNPGPRLTRLAEKEGWPITRYSSRGAGGPTTLLRRAIGFGSLFPIAYASLGVGLLTRSKRKGVNLLTEAWPRVLLQAHGVSLRVVGEHNARAPRPAIFVFNHRNQADTFIVAAVVRDNFTGVAKKELLTNPLFGTVGRIMDVAFVDRSDAKAAVSTLKEAEKLAAQGLSIIIAPEGTRSDEPGVGAFKKGAFVMAMSAGLPIIPVVIRNAERVAGRDSTTLNPGTVDVAVLSPVATADWSKEDLPDRIDEVRAQFLDALADWPEEGDPRVR